MTRPRGTLLRRQDWPELLAAFLAARAGLAFSWGTQDCALLAADAVRLLTGVDAGAPWRQGLAPENPLAPWACSYTTEAEADDILRPHGGLEGLADACYPAIGAPRCPPGFLWRGDPALVAVGNVLAMGVATGEGVAIPGPDRLHIAPLGAVRAAWAA